MHQKKGMEYGGSVLSAGGSVGNSDALSCDSISLWVPADNQYPSCLDNVPDCRESAGKCVEKPVMESMQRNAARGSVHPGIMIYWMR